MSNIIKFKETFVHHVYFWLKNPENVADKAELIQGLTRLAALSTIRMHHIGTPAATNRAVIDSSYAVSWLCIFDDAEAQAVYQTHPIHLKFVEDCKHLWDRVVVYDSEAS
jgi:Stress responsive A/B Barrel Domain